MSRRASWIGLSFTSWALVALGPLALPGCNDGEESEPVITPRGLAAQQCAQLVQCNCGVGNDVEGCTASLSSNLDSVASAAEAAGLEYDADCAARQSAWIEELGCAVQEDDLLADASCALNCPLYHGYVGPGEPCTIIADRATTCAAGLECLNGICEDVCNNWRLAEGATCYDPVNQPTGTCVTGTHCDVGVTNRCIPTPQRDEPCPGGVCREGDFCNTLAQPEAICQAIGGVGDPCLSDSACETGSCGDNVCASYPTLGEFCSDMCAEDLYCQGGVCTVKQRLGQSCDFSLPCASGLSCNGSVCEQGQPLACFGAFF
jgi:hypothetical protein